MTVSEVFWSSNGQKCSWNGHGTNIERSCIRSGIVNDCNAGTDSGKRSRFKNERTTVKELGVLEE